MCVRGRDAYTGADLERAWPIDRIKLPAKERNQYVFKGEAGCMWCVRVGFIDTARRVQREAVPEKERSHFEVKCFHFQYLSTKIWTLVRNTYIETVSRFEFPLSQQKTSQCLRSTNDKLAGKINSLKKVVQKLWGLRGCMRIRKTGRTKQNDLWLFEKINCLFNAISLIVNSRNCLQRFTTRRWSGKEVNASKKSEKAIRSVHKEGEGNLISISPSKQC